ncbi:hypothetical protein QFC20_004388 [Naganishia adeliensis]|uniref:Uncharacterized protein n=1 Tax=Naganishia adeliensis TaxID=92952 RepID=A0ACC2W1Y0_9TREE|nr:hypothetical protein QFC20_004388 [Naganishia adeliensis]
MASPSTEHQAVNGLSKKLEQLQTSTPNGNGSLSRNGSDSNINRIRKDTIGYKATDFPAKEQQRKEVERIVLAQGFIPRELVAGEVGWYYQSLGIDNTYFMNEMPITIAEAVLSLYAAKVLAYTKHDPTKLTIDLESITDEETSLKTGGKKKEGAVFIHTSKPGVSVSEGPGAHVEKRIDQLYLNDSTVDKAYRLETYRSTGAISASSSQQVRCYFVTRSVFPEDVPKALENDMDSDNKFVDIRSVSDRSFLEKASDNTLEIYQGVMNEVVRRSGPVIELFEVEESRERRVVIGYKMGGTRQFFSALSDLYHFYGLYSARKYVEQFANGVTIISMYLNPMPNSKAPPIEHSIHQVIKETSLLYCMPENPFFTARVNDPDAHHAVQEATYAYVGWIFAQHFCNRLGSSYLSLKNILDENNTTHAEALQNIRTRLRDETFTRDLIRDVIQGYPELVRALYINFAMTHYPAADEASQLTPTLSFQRLKTEQPLSDSDLLLKIRKTVTDEHASQILEALLIFNKHVLKTNFYQPTKVALSFRLKPDFLPAVEYPLTPFGIFFVVGSDFRGFHVRFKDVARGGVRIVRSRGKEDYNKNARTLFDEAYALSSTQQKKNCLIVEGGAKAAILPNLGASFKLCFEKFVDSVIDLLLPGQTPGIKGKIVDMSGRTEPEILFFGPDENTADLMDWACNHARKRGAPWWKSFTTGKTASTLGGIPHDVYGMTSLSVRQFVAGIYRSHGLREKDITKMSSGGPDGDLGSNEIKLSSDKTVTIIDGTGVMHDPHGLDRSELLRMANARLPSAHFDRSKLSKDGYVILVEDKDVTLPSGEVIADGMHFRNTAHFRFKCDIFVPCGGRPEAINISNVNKLFDSEGRCNFQYVVEGANLFITQQARLFLEKRGVELYKDSSANKGGVTSSSQEVLAGLALKDDEYESLMMFKDEPSAFYQSYVKDIQDKITENAAAEFVAINKEYARQGGRVARTLISDRLATALNDLQGELETSDLFNDEKSRRLVLRRAFPKTLVDKVGLDELLKRLPESYLRALWSVHVASSFIFSRGMDFSPVEFYLFFRSLESEQ